MEKSNRESISKGLLCYWTSLSLEDLLVLWGGGCYAYVGTE